MIRTPGFLRSTPAKRWIAGAVLHACVAVVWVLWAFRDSSARSGARRGGSRLPAQVSGLSASPREQPAMGAAGALKWLVRKKACDADPAVRLRSAFVDKRREALQRFHASPCGWSPARWGGDKCTTRVDSNQPLAVVVGMAEAKIHMSPDQALVACVVEVPGTADAITVGEARLRNLTVSHPEGWTHKNFNFLTHAQAQMLCVVPALAVSAAADRGAADLRVRLVYEGCEEHRPQHAVAVRPDQHIPAVAAGTLSSRVDICAATVHFDGKWGAQPGALAGWIEHHRSLGVHTAHLYVSHEGEESKAQASQPGPGASERDRAALAEAVATGWVVLHSWNPLGLRTARSEGDYVTAAQELTRMSKAPRQRVWLEKYLATLPQIYYYSQVSGFRPTNHPLYRNQKSANGHTC